VRIQIIHLHSDYIVTQNSDYIVTQNSDYIVTQNSDYIVTQNSDYIVTQNSDYIVTQIVLVQGAPTASAHGDEGARGGGADSLGPGVRSMGWSRGGLIIAYMSVYGNN
jgi:hypothetical protein